MPTAIQLSARECNVRRFLLREPQQKPLVGIQLINVWSSDQACSRTQRQEGHPVFGTAKACQGSTWKDYIG